MSISTPSGEQKSPSSVKVTAKPGAKPGTKTGVKPSTPAGKGKAGGPRKPIQPVKVTQDRNWGPIALFAAVGVLAAVIIGWGVWAAWGPGGAGHSWQGRANDIEGIQTFDRATLTNEHKWGTVQYDQNPPVGGNHTFPPVWQQCMGNIYDQPIPNEHAVHSLEHGAAWLTYRSDLPADQVTTLESYVRNKGYTMMSPVENLDSPVSLQAWGYKLKVDDVNDSRIAEFLNLLAENATIEPGATCLAGTTAVGTVPLTEEQASRLNSGA